MRQVFRRGAGLHHKIRTVTGSRRDILKKIIVRCIIMFMVFFAGTACLIVLDGVCGERTGAGGNLVFDIDNMQFFK